MRYMYCGYRYYVWDYSAAGYMYEVLDYSWYQVHLRNWMVYHASMAYGTTEVGILLQ